MKKEYDFSDSVKNPYARQKKRVTPRPGTKTTKGSPFEVPAVATKASTQDILDAIADYRKRRD